MKNNVVKNTTWLFIFQISKIVFPFITLPYLTRVLTTDTYGTVTYVKTIMTYMQIFVDFGFALSGTKEIVVLLKKRNQKKIYESIGDTILARILLGIIGFFAVVILCLIIPILRENYFFTLLSYFVVFESIFLMDFIFRGYEKMHVIAIRFIMMKTISTLLTFIIIKNDSSMLFIPVLDIISSFVAIILAMSEIKKMEILFAFSNINNVIRKIIDSFIYFLSDVASTSFNAFSTIIIGLYLTKSDIAFWGICMQIIGTIQALYNPISGGLYPEMIKNKNINIIKKALKFYLPLVLIGCLITYLLAPLGIRILGGNKYLSAVPIFRLLIPCLFFGFLANIIGWPVLGALNKQNQVTLTTIVSVLVNIVLLIALIGFNKFTLINITIVRIITEVVLFSSRCFFYIRYKSELKNF